MENAINSEYDISGREIQKFLREFDIGDFFILNLPKSDLGCPVSSQLLWFLSLRSRSYIYEFPFQSCCWLWET